MSSTTITNKTFRMNAPYRLIVNDDGGRGFRNYVAPLTAEQYLSAVFDVLVKDKPVDALFWCGLQNPAGAAWYDTKVGELVRGNTSVSRSDPPAMLRKWR